MAEAKDMTNAERCSLFLIDEYTGELVSKVFDGDEATHEVRIEEGRGIAGHVIKTGKLLNIRNAYQHPLFYKGVDEQTGFKTRFVDLNSLDFILLSNARNNTILKSMSI